LWRVTLPASAFGGQLAINQLGSYVVLGNTFFHVWCADEESRRLALVERINAYLGARSNAGGELVRQRLMRLTAQLELDADVPTVRRWAVELGRTTLAEQLNTLD
jgi:hypothetical protein